MGNLAVVSIPGSWSLDSESKAYPNLAGQTRPGEPTRIANHRDYTMVDQGEVINLRLWDLPGTIGREHLLVDNFQAAVICFSIGDEQSWRRVAEYVRLCTYLANSIQQQISKEMILLVAD